MDMDELSKPATPETAALLPARSVQYAVRFFKFIHVEYSINA